ncbi:phosphoglycolate phosphatase [Kosakonia sacchari]|uniref:phosphoglycolate phosphatase n=1 Tax=Kosakonia sacchari TaxID=1158459 RepID=UPI001585A2D0|nr:phosphoglycolate phosphatase [Kosakonia sacchari]NUL35068.1 phosphoglycolate phosphatase [Kosakonia sacchari]
MNSWAATDLEYAGQGGASIPNKSEPSAAKQATGFAPTYFDVNRNLVVGDAMTAQEWNYIFNDIYSQLAALAARIPTA